MAPRKSELIRDIQNNLFIEGVFMGVGKTPPATGPGCLERPNYWHFTKNENPI